MFTLSPLGRRRLAHFKANRRGWWSLWLFIGLFTVCLGPLVGNRYSFCMMTGAPLLIGLMCTPRAHNLPETGKPVCRR